MIRFPVGRVVATPGALRALEKAEQLPAAFLDRHVHGDWGDVPGVCVATERKPGKFLLPIPLIRSTESFCSYPISLAAHSLVMGVGKELCKIRPSRQVGRPSEHDKHLACWASKPVYRHFALSSTG
jgi:hypothetical protein